MKKRFSLLCILFSMILCISGCKTNISKNGIEIDSSVARKVLLKTNEKTINYRETSDFKFTLKVNVEYGGDIVTNKIEYSKKDRYMYLLEKNTILVDYNFNPATYSSYPVYDVEYTEYFKYIDKEGDYIEARNHDGTRYSSNKSYTFTRYDAIKYFNEDLNEKLKEFDELNNEIQNFIKVVSSNNPILEKYKIKYNSKGSGYLYMTLDSEELGESSVVNIENNFVTYYRTTIDLSKLPEYANKKLDYKFLTTKIWLNLGYCDVFYPNLSQYKLNS